MSNFLKFSLIFLSSIYLLGCGINVEPLPSSIFNIQNNNCQAPCNVTFNYEGNGGKITWDFGDGTTSNEKNPLHLYQTGGSYDVKLRITGNSGSVGSKSLVTILPQIGYYNASYGGGGSDDRGLYAISDKNGNIYVAGYYGGTANFYGQTVSAFKKEEMFVAKFNSSGQILWIRPNRISTIVHPTGLALDNSGYVFVSYDSPDSDYSGYIRYEAERGIDTGSNMELQFTDGTHIKNIACSSDNYIYFSGYFTKSFNGVVNSTNQPRGFLAKYSQERFLLKSSILDKVPSVIDNVKIIGNNTIYATGYANQNNYNKTFINKLDNNLSTNWIKYESGSNAYQPSYNFGTTLAIDGQGSIYLAKSYTGKGVTFDNISITNTNSVSSSSNYILKYTSDGTLVWLKSTNNEMVPNGIFNDSDGNIWLTGSVTVATTTPVVQQLAVHKYNLSNGNLISQKYPVTTKNEIIGTSVTTDSNKNIIVTGWYRGSQQIGGNLLPSLGGDDFYMLKFKE